MKWKSSEIKLLGKMTDVAAANRIGRHVDAVRNKRRSLGIAPYMPYARDWSESELALLGTMSDQQLADKLGCAQITVMKKRNKLGIPPKHIEHIPRGRRRKYLGKI